ncbi:MAG: tape measure protein [Victivallaceae bacterium]|nr:tape measure protein [Victivallaceae bacterium]
MAKELKIVLSVDAQKALGACLQVNSSLADVGREAAAVRSRLDAAGRADAGAVAPDIRMVDSALVGAGAEAVRVRQNLDQMDNVNLTVGKKIADVRDELDKTGDAAKKAGADSERAADRSNSALNSISGGLKHLGGSLVSLGIQWAKYIAVAATAAATAAGYALIKLGAGMEQTRLRFKTMLGSWATGNAMLKQFNEFANVTPFTNDEVINAGRALLVYGVNAQKIMSTLKAVGDVASGSGKNLEELAGIFGKVIAKGKADSEALNQLAEAGIPIIATLAQMYGATGEAVYEMASKGKIASGDIEMAFQRMTAAGGTFENMMAQQSRTAAGQWSTLVGTLETVAGTVGEQLMPIVTAFLAKLNLGVESLKKMADDKTLLVYILDIAAYGLDVIKSITVGAVGLYGYLTSGISMVYHAIRLALTAILTLISGALTGVVAVVEGLIDSLTWMYNKIAAITPGMDKIERQQGKWTSFMADVTSELFKSGGADATGIAAAASDMAGVGDKQRSAGRAIGAQVDTIKALIADVKAGKFEKRDVAEETQTQGAAGSAAIVASDKSAAALPTAKDVRVDSLAQMGLYNWGGLADNGNRLDTERNGILKQILHAVSKDKAPALALEFAEV